MSPRTTLLLDMVGNTWSLCLAILLFFGVIAGAALFLRVKRLDFILPSRPAFWMCIVPGFILLALCLTLIDRPRFEGLSDLAASWMFMLSAFLGVPLTIPLLTGAAWAGAHRFHQIPLRVSSLALVMLGSFALGCAASNMHDIVWCGAVTDWFSRHEAAGYDLDVFVALGAVFGIPREVMADYATLGPCAVVMVLGEMTVAAACFTRLGKGAPLPPVCGRAKNTV